MNKPIEKKDMVYNRKAERLQMNPIGLTESPVGLEEIFAARNAADKAE